MKRIVLYVLTYITVTFVATFGTITTNNFLNKIVNSNNSNSQQIEIPEKTDGEKFLDSLLDMGGANIDFDFNMYEQPTVKAISFMNNMSNFNVPTIKVAFSGMLNIPDLENIKLAGNLNVKFDNTEVIIDLAYIDNIIYISNETMNVKLESSSITNLKELLPIFGLNMNFGDVFADIDTNKILENFQNLKAEQLESGDLKLPLKLTDKIILDIITDSNYTIKNIQADRLELDDKIATITANLTQDETVVIESPEKDKNFVDITKTFNIVDNIKEVLSNKKLHLDVDASVLGEKNLELKGSVDIDFNNNVNLFASFGVILNGSTYKISVGYIDEDLYLVVNNIKLKLEKDTLQSTIDTILNYFHLDDVEQNLLSIISKLIPDFELIKILQVDLSNLNINNLFEFAMGEDEVISITISGNSLGINNDIILEIGFDQNDQLNSISVSNVQILKSVFNAKAVYSNQVVIPVINQDDYINLQDLSGLITSVVNTINEIKSTKVLAVDLSAEMLINDVSLDFDGNLCVDFNDMSNIKTYFNFNVVVDDKKINIMLGIVNNEIYLAIDNLKFKTNFDEIGDILQATKPIIKNQNILDFISKAIQIIKNENFIDNILEFISGKTNLLTQSLIASLNSTVGKFSLQINKDVLNLDNNLDIIINYNTKITSFVVSNIKKSDLILFFEGSLSNKSPNFDFINYEFVSLKNLDKLISAVINSANNIITDKKIATKIDTTIIKGEYCISLKGDLLIDNSTFYTNLIVTINEKEIPVLLHFIDDNIYVNFDGLKVKLPVNKISDLTELFNVQIDFAEIVNIILPNINFEQIKSGDWSSLSLNFIKNIEIYEKNTIILLNKEYFSSENDIFINLGYNTEIQTLEINNFEINGYNLCLKAELINFDEMPDISEDYSDISNIKDFVLAVKQTISEVMENKHIAFDLNTSLKLGEKDCKVTGKVFVDFSKVNQEQISFNDLEIYASIQIEMEESYNFVINVKDGYLFVTYENLKLKINLQSIGELINSVKEILPSEVSDINFSDIIKGSILEEILNGDYSSVKVELIKEIILSEDVAQICLSKDILAMQKDFALSLGYSDKITSFAINCVEFNDLSLNLNLILDYEFVPNLINEEEYQDISNIKDFILSAKNTINDICTNKEIALNISNAKLSVNNNKYSINGIIYVNFNNAIKEINGKNQFDIKGLLAHIELTITDQTNYSHNVNLTYDGTTFYLIYNNLKLKLNSENLDATISLIEQLKFISESLKTQDLSNISMRNLVEEAKQQAQRRQQFDFLSIIKTVLPNFDFDAFINNNLGEFNIGILKDISLTNNSLNVIFNSKLINSISDIDVNIKFDNKITNLVIDGFNVNGISVFADLSLISNYLMPTITDASDYTNFDLFENIFVSTLNTAIDVVDNKHIAFDLQTDFVYTSIKKDAFNNPTLCTETLVNLLPTSKARFDWNDAYSMEGETNNFDIKKFKMYVNFEVVTKTNTYYYTNNVRDDVVANSVTNNHSIEVTYINNEICIRYNKMFVKIDGGSLNQIIEKICEIVGVEPDTSMFDNIKDFLGKSNDTSWLSNLKVEMIKSLVLTGSHFGFVADISILNLIQNVGDLNVDIEYYESGLKNIEVKDLSLKNISVDNLKIALTEFTSIEKAPDGEYIDLSGIENLLDAVKNSIEFKDFEIDGNVKLKINVIGINIDWDVPVNVKLKLLENGSFEANIKMGAIPVVPGVNDDVPFKVGNVVSGLYSGLNRILSIYIKDDFVYLYRSETVPTTIFQPDRLYEKKMKVHIDTLLDDPLYYIFEYGFGFSEKIMTEIYNSIYKVRKNPIDFSNVLKGFSSSDNYYSLTLNLKELLEDDKLDTMTLGIKTINHNENLIIGGFTVDMFMPVANSVEITIKSDNLNLNNIGGTSDMGSMYEFINDNISLEEGALWDAYDGDWKLSSQREFTIRFVTNCDQVLEDVKGVAGSNFVLPTLDSYFVDTNEERVFYSFVGWYTTENFMANTEYNENIMSRKDTILYAKWSSISKKYVTIDFVTNGGEAKDSITKLEGEELILPSYTDILVVEIDNTTYTKQFDGWYVDSELTTKFDLSYMPNQNIQLFAKWSVIDCVSSYLLEVYDINEKIFTRRIVEGQTVELFGIKFKESTLYYLNDDYTNQIDMASFTMPQHDVSIYISNKYNLKVISNYGKVLNYEFEVYQGDVLTLYEQSSYEFDTYLNGKQDKRYYYTFNGYFVDENMLNELTLSMPNNNVEIVASWTEQVKNYYTITFDTRWYVPIGWVNEGIEVSAPNQIESLTVLQGADVDLRNYISTTQRKYTKISKTYTWKSTSWGLEPFKNLSVDKGVTGLTNVQQNYTLYACWEKQ